MSKHNSTPILQLTEKKIGLKIVNLLRNGKADDAVRFIEEGRRKGLSEFNHQVINYLYSRSLKLIASNISVTAYSSSTKSELKQKLSHDLAQNFKEVVENNNNHWYQTSEEVNDEAIVAKLLNAKNIAEQERILPYKGKIYLPTDKYSESEQVEGIKKTAAFLGKANAEATRTRLQTLKLLIQNRSMNECFIIANGPSLKSTNLAMLRDVFIIGLNSIFLHPYITPHVIVCEDHLVGEDRAQELNEQSHSIKIIPGYLTYCIAPDSLTIVINHRPRISFPVDIDFSANIDKITYTGGTVTYTALQIAIGLGFKKISLVGVDASYKVENVKEQNNYATGILESLGDDPNHFNSGYFGKGYRWHDPNPLRMMQAYSVVERYATMNMINIVNLTRGGMLDVFKREDYSNRIYEFYPKVCVIDWIDINAKAATGEVKKALFKDWPKDKFLHIYSSKPVEIAAYKSSFGDIFLSSSDSILSIWKAVIENNPNIFYWRPTHNRPILNLFTVILFLIERKPYAIHLMDYWTIKVNDEKLRLAYEQALESSIKKAAHFFVISQRMKSRLCKKFKLPASKVTVAHNYTSNVLPMALTPLPKNEDKRLVFYSGSLDPDQSIDPLLDICEGIKLLNQRSSVQYDFIVRTSEFHVKASGHLFNSYDFVILQVQSDTYVEYIQQMAKADICIMCYGFGSESREYLLDSMANKLPDLVTAKAKFFAYGDSEIGTLNYLKQISYPFLEFKRDSLLISKHIESIASMNYQKYSEICAESLAHINNEFTEMAQCHVFQQQLASSSWLLDRADDGCVSANYAELVKDYQKVLALSSTAFPEKLDDEFRLMLYCANHDDLIGPVYKLVRNHGLTWSINKTKTKLEKIIDSISGNRDLTIESLAWMIASQRHPRFSELWSKLFNVIVIK